MKSSSHLIFLTDHITRCGGAVLLGFSLLLSGCASTSSHKMDNFSTAERWQMHQRQLNEITQYQVNGSFAYLSGAKKNYAKFSWQQQSPEQIHLQLNAPWGSRIATLIITPDGAIFEDDKGQQATDNQVENLLFRLTEMNLPISHFKTLLLGLVDETVPYTLNAQGLLKTADIQIDDQHWQANFTEYQTYKKQQLPKRIELTYEQAHIKLNLNQWKIQ